MRILITGAGGFIGSHLVEAAVRAGHTVRAMVNYNSRGDIGHLEDVAADVRSEIDIRALDVRDDYGVNELVKDRDAVLHLAALIGIPYSYLAPSSYVAVNISGTLNVLNAARRHGSIQVVHTSTSEVYGSAQYTPIDERHPLVGQSPYSASKIGADQLAESFARSFDVPVTIIRPFNTFGPRQSLRAVIPTLAAQLLDDTVSHVRAGTLDTVRDFTFVTDTAAGFLCALGHHDVPNGSVINLGTGTGHTIESVYRMLCSLSGKDKPVEADSQRVRPSRSEVLELISNNQLAREKLGWSPQVSLEEGLARTLRYLQERPVRNAQAYRV